MGASRLTEVDPTLLKDLERLVDADSRGDPESLLRWTSKSVRHLAEGLRELGHQAHFTTVAQLLRGLGYSLQANVKTREGRQHPDRDAQFRHINTVAKRAVEHGQPVISVDTKKKELVGDFKNAGREWRPKGEPELVRVHDFKDKLLGKAIPYGVYDIGSDQGWVNVGIDHDTAQFAVNSIRSLVGAPRPASLPERHHAADHRRLRRLERQPHPAVEGRAAERSPTRPAWRSPSVTSRPARAKWNRIEHRLFSFITMNWRGKPLVSLETIISLIGATTTSTGLEVYARLDPGTYPDKIKVPTPTSNRQPPRRRVPPRMELPHQTQRLIIYEPLGR